MTNKKLMMLGVGAVALAYLLTNKKANARTGESYSTQYDNFNSSQDDVQIKDYKPRMGIGFDGRPAMIYPT